MQRGIVFYETGDGWKVMLNPNPDVAHLPDHNVYMAISPSGKKYVGDESNIMYLMTSEYAAGWRKRFA